MAVLSVHEGMPGRHYQLEKLLNDPTKPDYIKYFGETAYCEGWALYTENLFNYSRKELFHKINYEILGSSFNSRYRNTLLWLGYDKSI